MQQATVGFRTALNNISPVIKRCGSNFNRMKNRHATIYTDGSCPKNGQGATSAGIGVYWGEGHPNNVGEPLAGRATNNRAEIIAASRGIQQAKAEGYSSVTVKTDSQFLKDSVEKWMPNWERNGYVNSHNKEVINKQDFLHLKNSMEGIDVRFEKVAGHSKDTGNQAADKLAREGACQASTGKKNF